MFGLKSGFWIRATLRRLNHEGIFSLIVHKGDEDAGSIFIILSDVHNNMVVLQEHGISWRRHTFEEKTTHCISEQVNTYLDRQKKYDPDLWIIEINVKNCSDLIEHSLGSRKNIDATIAI